jgi:hypothetical protein
VAAAVVMGFLQRGSSAHPTTSRATSTFQRRANASFEIGAAPMDANMARMELRVGTFLRTSKLVGDWLFHVKSTIPFRMNALLEF